MNNKLNLKKCLFLLFVIVIIPGRLFSQEEDIFQKVRDNDITGIKAMIEAGADINQVQEYNGFTPIMTACYYDQAEVAKYLIEAGADLDLQEKTGYTALIMACQYQREAIAEMLIEGGANINIKGKDGASALLAAASSSEALTELLISKGADISDRTDDAGLVTQGLMGVLQGRHKPEFIARLIKSGADVNEICKADYAYGWTPLFMAAANNRPDLVKLLIDNGADVNVSARDGKTALSLAEKEGASEVIEILKASGAK